MDRYGRPLSPGGRRVAQPGRSSTGTLVYPSPFDPYYAPPRSSREFATAAGPRTSADRVHQSRAVPRYRPESPPSRQSRDDYVVRPRRLTLDPDAAPTRRPLSVIGPSEPNRTSRPVITTSDRPSSPLSKPDRSRRDDPYLLQPASSIRREHGRNYSLGSTGPSLSGTGERDGRDRRERGGYRSAAVGGGRSGYNLDQPLVRQPEGRDRGGYEYTDRREQMYRDTEPRPRPRRDSYTGGARERPLSMTELGDYLPRERTNRDAGPPVTMRGFGGVGRSGSLRQGPSSLDYDPAPSDFSRDDYERRKAHIPRVALHQDPGNAYAPIRDDDSILDDSRDRRPRKTIFEDEVTDSKPREAYDDQRDRIQRPVVDDGRINTRPKDRHPEDYSRISQGMPHARGHVVSDRNKARVDDRDKRRPDDVSRQIRVDAARDRGDDVSRDRRDDIPRERQDDAPRERRDDRHRHRHDDLPREKRHHADHVSDAGHMAGGAAVAATGVAAEAARSRHRHKGSRDGRDVRYDPARDRLGPPEPVESNTASTVSREESDEERRERHRRRRERKEREEREAREVKERESRQTTYGAVPPQLAPGREAVAQDPDPKEALPREYLAQEPLPQKPVLYNDQAPLKDNTVHEQPSYERHSHDGRSDSIEPPAPHPRHHRHHSRRKSRDSFSDSDSSTSSASSTRRPRNVRVVTPTSERAPSQPAAPKSILRPPREKFPEDPAPVREGVAPLKDAGKKGIPPNARWTKIDRKLVNPEALEAGNERYEERVDYVIVLRVLTKEEIEQYAAKTQELRAARTAAAQTQE
ncbi:MAG: hypothetical protein Q9188_002387 [Gyalolechia gomerana]